MYDMRDGDRPIREDPDDYMGEAFWAGITLAILWLTLASVVTSASIVAWIVTRIFDTDFWTVFSTIVVFALAILGFAALWYFIRQRRA